MLEAILPSRSFLESIYILLENKTLYEKFDIELRDLLKNRIESNNGKLNKKDLPRIYKAINKKYGISIPKFVKYFDSMLNFYKSNDEITLISCFNSAKTFDSLILPGLSKELKLRADEGEFDFEVIHNLSYKYIEYITPNINSKNFSKYVDLVYESDNVKVYMPLTNIAFKYVLSLTKKDFTWCTRNASTWIKYNKKFACMIAVIDNEAFQMPEDYSVISLKVNYSGNINKHETCDRFNNHMGDLVDNIPEIADISSACRTYLQTNIDLKDKITNRSYYDKEFLIDLFTTKNYSLVAKIIQSVFVGDDESLTAIGNLEDTLSDIASLINDYRKKYAKVEDIKDSRIREIIQINFSNVLTSSLVLAIPEIFYLDIIEYHDYMPEFCEALDVDLGDIFDEIVGVAESSRDLKYVYTALCYNDSFGNERIDLNDRLSMLVEVLNQNNPNLYNDVIGCIDKKELINTSDYSLIAELFNTKYFYNIDYNKQLYWILIEAFLILDKKNMLNLIDKEKISNIDKGLFITGNFSLKNYNIDIQKNANILYNDLVEMYENNVKDKDKVFLYGEKAIINLNKSPKCFEAVSNLVIRNKNYKLFIVYAGIANRTLSSKFIRTLSPEVLKEIKKAYISENDFFKSEFDFVWSEINKFLVDLPQETTSSHTNFSENDLDSILKNSTRGFSIDNSINKKHLCLLLLNYLKNSTTLLSYDSTPSKTFSKNVVLIIEFLSNSVSITRELKELVDFVVRNGNESVIDELKNTTNNQLNIILDELVNDNLSDNAYINLLMI
jgi:hypothetical protein